MGLDDTIERRWGARIAARGIYRDPVRSSHGHFVKTSGLRWLSLMVAVAVSVASTSASSITGKVYVPVLAPAATVIT